MYYTHKYIYIKCSEMHHYLKISEGCGAYSKICIVPSPLPSHILADTHTHTCTQIKVKLCFKCSELHHYLEIS